MSENYPHGSDSELPGPSAVALDWKGDMDSGQLPIAADGKVSTAAEAEIHRRKFHRSKLRRCVVSGHQEYWAGWFHGFFGGTSDGQPCPCAVVETETGSIRVEGAHKIEFNVPDYMMKS